MDSGPLNVDKSVGGPLRPALSRASVGKKKLLSTDDRRSDIDTVEL